MGSQNCLDNCTDDEIFATYSTTAVNYFPSEENGHNVCLACHPNCAICHGGSEMNCTECAPTYFLIDNTDYLNSPNTDPTVWPNGTACVQICADGTYLNYTTEQCELCEPTCDTCFGGNSTDCLTCTDTTKVL